MAEDDRDALAEVLLNQPFSEVRRLFNAAIEAGMPATLEALKRVTPSAAPPDAHIPPPHRDGDLDELFKVDVIDG